MRDPALERYRRQIAHETVGEQGQRRLLASEVTIIGCGALGATSADLLNRMGVGRLRLVDRDVLELSNLNRQVLYSEAEARDGVPKAVALAENLRRIREDVELEVVTAHLDAGNADELLRGDLILDGTDNFETRFLINDHCVREGRPWVYAGCIGTRGLTATIRPGRSACLRCLLEQPPPAGASESCEVAGILAPAAVVTASLQVMEAVKILLGREEDLRPGMLHLELWAFRAATVPARGPARPREDCPCCGERRFDWLEGQQGRRAEVLCGREMVQVLPRGARGLLDLPALTRQLRAAGCEVKETPYLLRVLPPGGLSLSVFPDGRVLVGGTDDAGRARALCDRLLGG